MDKENIILNSKYNRGLLFSLLTNVHPITCHEGTEGEKRYSSTHSLTPAPFPVHNE
jgi:hypothetical protein